MSISYPALISSSSKSVPVQRLTFSCLLFTLSSVLESIRAIISKTFRALRYNWRGKQVRYNSLPNDKLRNIHGTWNIQNGYLIDIHPLKIYFHNWRCYVRRVLNMSKLSMAWVNVYYWDDRSEFPSIRSTTIKIWTNPFNRTRCFISS